MRRRFRLGQLDMGQAYFGRMENLDPQVRQVYAEFGLAMSVAQLLERQLVGLVVAAYEPPSGKLTAEEYDGLLAKLSKQTLGALIQKLRESFEVPADFDLRLQEALRLRNWLAHGYFHDQTAEFQLQDGRSRMILELDTISGRLHELYGYFDHLLISWLSDPSMRTRKLIIDGLRETKEQPIVILGFDPGGARQFGWCVAQPRDDGKLQLHASGIASHAAGALRAVLTKAANLGRIAAAGIDSPLLWVADGDRKADKTIREAIQRVGATNVGGRVQQVNSLRGACLSQGILVAHLLRRELPEIRITESHPKALLWLLHVASNELPVANVGINHLVNLIQSESLHMSEHERDAALGAVAAWAMMSKRSGWRDLYQDEQNAFAPVSPVEYWMPVGDPKTQAGGEGTDLSEGR